MEIQGLILDPNTNSPVVVLHAKTDDEWYLPIWIGPSEANSIAIHLEGVETPRPMTHDLIPNFLDTCGWSIQSILVSELKDSVFYARIHIVHQSGEEKDIDSRPSDAIAIAVRVGAPIYVAQSVLDQARVPGVSGDDALRLILERLCPEDMGEYQM